MTQTEEFSELLADCPIDGRQHPAEWAVWMRTTGRERRMHGVLLDSSILDWIDQFHGTPATLDDRHLQLINQLLDEGGWMDCDDRRLDNFHDDRGAKTDTINGLIKAGIAHQIQLDNDVFRLYLAGN